MRTVLPVSEAVPLNVSSMVPDFMSLEIVKLPLEPDQNTLGSVTKRPLLSGSAWPNQSTALVPKAPPAGYCPGPIDRLERGLRLSRKLSSPKENLRDASYSYLLPIKAQKLSPLMPGKAA